MLVLVFLGESSPELPFIADLSKTSQYFSSLEEAKHAFYDETIKIFSQYGDGYGPENLDDIKVSSSKDMDKKYDFEISILDRKLIVISETKNPNLILNYTELFYGTSGGLHLTFSALVIEGLETRSNLPPNPEMSPDDHYDECSKCDEHEENNSFQIYIEELTEKTIQEYRICLKQRLENLRKIVDGGDHAVLKNIREEYWNCVCSNEDVNATKCKNCYGINLLRHEIFDHEIRMLTELLKNVRNPN